MVERDQYLRDGKALILLVDDHPIVTKGLSELIDEELDLQVCGIADDIPSAFSQLAELKPNLVIVDLMLRDGSGLDLVKQIAASYPGLPVLVLSMHSESLYAERALRAGALGYVMKEEAPDVILMAIRRVLRGRVYLSGAMTDNILHKIRPTQPKGGASIVDDLSDRELEVFELLGRGATTREIAGKLKRSVKTIETHRTHLKQKLNAANASQLVRIAVEWVQKKDDS